MSKNSKNEVTTDYNDADVVAKYGIGPITRKLVDLPESMRLMGDVKGLKVLDLGCGNGEFTQLLTKQGAQCLGIDYSQTFIDNAKQLHPELDFRVLSGDNLEGIADKSFDKIIMRMVLVNIHDEKVFKGVFRECARVLKPNGEFVFSMHHPLMIRNFKDSLREMVLPKGGSITQKQMPYKLTILLDDCKNTITFDCCHWRLEDLKAELASNNFHIHEITAPGASEKDSMPNEYINDLKITPQHLYLRSILKG